MLVILRAGETVQGSAVERTLHLMDGCPKAEAIAATLTGAAEAVRSSPEAVGYVDVVSQDERLGTAMQFLQGRSGEMYARSQRDFAIAVGKALDDAALERTTPEKVLLAFDVADRLRSGFSVLLREAGQRLTAIKPSVLTSEAKWLEQVIAEIERKLEQHQAAVAEAVRPLVEIEGGVSLARLEGSYSSELSRLIGELSTAAKGLRKQARELQDPESVAQERMEAMLTSGSGTRRV